MSYDLSRIDFSKADGGEAARFEVMLPASNGSGAAPQVITATQDPDKYLVSCVDDYDSGLVTLLLQRNDKGEITGYEANALDLKQPYKAIQEDRLNIQRAQSAVLVERDGVQYAIVSDDNYAFNDAYWKAQFEAPMFVSTGFGPPTAMGGGMTALPVKVGGKLGIIKDPFGEAVFLGATDPLDGQGIVNLSVSEDGKVLIGQLKGGYGSPVVIAKSSISGTTIDFGPSMTQKPNANVAWDVDALINAAMANDGLTENQRLTYGLEVGNYVLPSAKTEGSNYTAAPAGTFFDPELVKPEIKGNVGDIVEVDLKKRIAYALLGISKLDTLSPTAEMEERVANLMKEMKDFKLISLENKLFKETNPEDIASSKDDGMTILTKDGYKDMGASSQFHKTIISKDKNGDAADFSTEGRLYLAPTLDKDDLNRLRTGGNASTKSVSFTVSYRLGDIGNHNLIEGIETGYAFATIQVVAEDADHGALFGDRPLDNPGYSTFTLNGNISNGNGDKLDIYRIEQRLKYLGYPAMGTPGDNTLKEFSVDGVFGEKEIAALKLFEKVVRYKNTNPDVRFANNENGADGEINKDDVEGKKTINWLNAYNAPHWMNIHQQLQYKDDVLQKKYSVAGWNSHAQTGDSAEQYGTSWMRDLMMAKNISELAQPKSWFNGAVDANLMITPKEVTNGIHKTHDLGMAFDLGVSNYIDKKGAQAKPEPLTIGIDHLKSTPWLSQYGIPWGTLYSHIPNEADYLAGKWNYENAVYLINLLPKETLNNQAAAMRDVLSLYSVLHNDGAVMGGWDDLRFKYGADVRTALFGGDANGGTLISKILIGDSSLVKTKNTYPNIHEILKRLGIAEGLDLQHHFHIYLSPPDIKNIEPTQSLLSDTEPTVVPSIATSDVLQQANAQALLDYVQSIIETGDELMFAMDIPYMPLQEASAAYVQLAAATMPSGAQPDYLLQECKEIETATDPASAVRGVDPAYMLKNYLQNKDNRDVDLYSIKTRLLEGTTHGSIASEISNDGGSLIWGKDRIIYRYFPLPDYVGNDKAIFMAEFEGKRYKIAVDLHVFTTRNDYDPTTCPEPKLIKVTPAKPVTLNISPLENNALAQTVGTTITLDDNAAGNNWYVDNNWLDNSEWLPTSNPYEWKAREGSEAYGKMDLLSVLLHEYGHVLGIEHSADSRDYMSTTLTAGTRRLPSPEEMQLMANLVAGVKDSLPSDPGIPLPSIPLALGALAFARRREDGDVGAGLVPAQEGYPQGVHYTVDYQVASNSELQGLDSPNKWLVTGNVNFAGNSATLGEASRTQTRLNQIFVVNPGDTTLSFTINKALTDQAGPDDAFEVALLDASTGANLLGGVGLTHSDAFLNIQGSGVERRASQVTRSVNADGSVTYMVDISAIAAGTTVNLSFDLIGFEDGNSTVTISQVQMGAMLAIAANDSVMATEDQAIHFNALSNDLHTQGYSPLIVVAPQHGVVTINADGSFSYVPDANYAGEDSFSTRYISKEISDHFLCKTCGISTFTYLMDQGNVVGVSVNIACLDGVDTTQMKPLMVDGRSF